MPWNDQSKNTGPQSGGPWGSGPRPPWGQPPRGPQAPQGPDLEEILRRFQERFRFGGGGGGRGGADRPLHAGPNGFAIAGALVVAAWVASGVYIVNPSEKAVVTRFGAYSAITSPGLHIHLPFPIEDVRVESVTRTRQTPVGVGTAGQNVESESQMLTGDKSIIEVNFTVFWQLSDVKNYVFNVKDPEDTVKAVAESAMREVIGKSNLDDIITKSRTQVEQSTLELMQKTLDSYHSGVMVVSIQMSPAQPPRDVNDAFQDVIKAGQDQIAKRNEATEYANKVVPTARGEAAAMLQDADAYRERAVREAEGEAQRFSSVLVEYKKAPRVTRERLYLETMERVYGGADKMILDGRSGAVPYLPLDQFRPGAKPAVTP